MDAKETSGGRMKNITPENCICGNKNVHTPECKRNQGKKPSQRKPWDDCICGNTNVHSVECKRNRRKNYLKKLQPLRRQERRKLRKKHICIVPGCSCKCPRKIVYYQYCPYHKKQQKESDDRRRR